MRYAGLLILLLPSFLLAQHRVHMECGVIDQSTLVQRLQSNRLAHKQGHLHKHKETLHIPVKFHLVGNDLGGGRIDFGTLIEELCFTNEVLGRSEMVLYMDGVHLVDDDSLYFYEGSYMDTLTYRTQRVLEIKETYGPNHVNVFITNEAGREGVAGFNNPFLDFIVIRKDQLGQESSVLAHELGHFFSIQHPHLGWEGDPFDRNIHGDTVKILTVGPANTLVEHMNGDNCEVSGDNICDTPPDYNFGFGWASDCRPYNRKVWDYNEDLITTSERNIMSYFNGCDSIFFSPGQVDAMRLDMASLERDFLDSDFVPTIEPIEEELTILSPTFNERVDYYNSALIEWSNIEHATGYNIKIRGAGQNLQYFTADTIIRIEDLSPRATYTLTIHPYHETGGCATSVSSLFKTSDALTSAIDLDLDNDINIYPNPIQRGDKWTIDLYTSQTSLADMQLILRSVEGKQVKSFSIEAKAGENRFVMDTHAIPSGMYILSLESEEGQFVSKLIVQE